MRRVKYWLLERNYFFRTHELLEGKFISSMKFMKLNFFHNKFNKNFYGNRVNYNRKEKKYKYLKLLAGYSRDHIENMAYL